MQEPRDRGRGGATMFIYADISQNGVSRSQEFAMGKLLKRPFIILLALTRRSKTHCLRRKIANADKRRFAAPIPLEKRAPAFSICENDSGKFIGYSSEECTDIESWKFSFFFLLQDPLYLDSVLSETCILWRRLCEGDVRLIQKGVPLF